MTQYLIRTLTDSTGHPFTHVTKARDNETYQVVEAESKAEALEMVKKPKGLLSYVKQPGGTLEEQLQRVQDNILNSIRKDIE
ncbi:DUF1381 domain-containing protein [Staphylococcus saprophyticus]|nr:DUF1381 domain-containing protein [Staphylococcus saprophyticus]